MSDLLHDATITPISVKEYSHLKEPFRSKWIQCIICHQVPAETIYRVRIPSQIQGDKKSFAMATVCCSEDCARKWIAKREPHFYTLEEMEGSSLSPTQESKPGWIFCFRQMGYYPESTERSGKWLIWLSAENIDRYWQRIKQAVETGKLGNQAKVSTAGSITSKHPRYVICVYTYDYQDREDVMRVRQVLRDLGIRRPIRYKADSDTRDGSYGNDYQPMYEV